MRGLLSHGLELLLQRLGQRRVGGLATIGGSSIHGCRLSKQAQLRRNTCLRCCSVPGGALSQNETRFQRSEGGTRTVINRTRERKLPEKPSVRVIWQSQ